jgi:SpoVK/Ycf46/Vps4 family AAA+-type ATPase
MIFSTPSSPVLMECIIPKARWDQLVLPDKQMTVLKEIVLHIRNRGTVHGKWGSSERSSREPGISVLFVGARGTGKSMAAEVLASELSLDLYRIDLSRVVSRYIGETEKTLNELFREAGTSNAILFFDEADALFDKRSEVRDPQDRYANIEINYLLQKLEKHEGIVILARNLIKDIDEAFLRRFRFIVQFPFPNQSEREDLGEDIPGCNAH